MRRRKDRVRKILYARDFAALKKWAGETRSALRILFSMTYDADILICHRAIEAIGETAAFESQYDLERVRNFVRSLFWLMTEESGGIGWHAPESVAEVCIKVPVLYDEYAKLLPQFLNEESFVPSTLCALHRLASSSLSSGVSQETILSKISGFDEEFPVYDFATGELKKKAMESFELL